MRIDYSYITSDSVRQAELMRPFVKTKCSLLFFISQLNPYIMMWTTRTGEKIAIDDMDINHLRNTLKMVIIREKALLNKANSIIKEYNNLVDKYNNLVDIQKSTSLTVTISKSDRFVDKFRNQQIDEDYNEDFDDSVYNK